MTTPVITPADREILAAMTIAEMRQYRDDLESVVELIKGYSPTGLEVRATSTGTQYFIKRPGKFEGEPLYIEWFYGKSLDGGADHEIDMSEPSSEDEGESCGLMASIFDVTPTDVALWPELAGRKYVGFWQRDDGFIVGLSDGDCAKLIEGEA